jgi:hypothetical protein
MTIPASKHLKLNRFYITDQSILTKFPVDKHRVHLDRHSFELMHEIFRSEEREGKFDFLVNLNIKINAEEKPGYVISLGAVGEFSLTKEKEMDEKVEAGYVISSALPMIINSARIYLMSVTAFFPYGPYSLPIVEMGDLLKKDE